MNTISIYDGLTVDYPDGFEVMTPEELKQFYLDDNPNRFGLWDKERHTVFVVYYHSYKGVLFFVPLPSNKALLERVEKEAAKAYRPYDYRLYGFYEKDVAGEKAYGYSYEYTLKGVNQIGDTVLFKKNEVTYTVYCYVRKENAEEMRPVYEEMVSSLRF